MSFFRTPFVWVLALWRLWRTESLVSRAARLSDDLRRRSADFIERDEHLWRRVSERHDDALAALRDCHDLEYVTAALGHLEALFKAAPAKSDRAEQRLATQRLRRFLERAHPQTADVVPVRQTLLSMLETHQQRLSARNEFSDFFTRRRKEVTDKLAAAKRLLLAPPAPKLEAPPAATLCRVLKFLCSARTYDEIVWPVIADMHAEYFAALDAGTPWKARWEHVKGVVNVLRQLGVFSVLKRTVDAVVALLTPKN